MSIECGNCTSACCKAGTEMVLSPDEVSFMIEGGTGLKPGPNKDKRYGLIAEYVLLNDCGRLNEDGLCEAFVDPKRPKICGEFAAGSVGCVAIRVARGVPTEAPVFDLTGEARFTDAAQVELDSWAA